MSIHNQIKIINRIKSVATNLQYKYNENHGASLELHKLEESLKKLANYLDGLDKLKPNYSTNETNQYMQAIYLHLDILKVELNSSDYQKLANGIKVLKTVLRFHPTKYSYFTFVIAWLFEMAYFI